MHLIKVSDSIILNADKVRTLEVYRDLNYNGWTYYLRATYGNKDHDDFDLHVGDNEVRAQAILQAIYDKLTTVCTII